MKKKAFTLIELLVSIVIIALIVTYLYESLGILKKSNDQLLSRDKERGYETDLKKLFISDIMQGYDLNISKTDSKEYDIMTLSSLNSLHGIKKPKIAYLVTKKENTLIRIEGVDFTLPLNSETVYHVKFDELKKNLEYFKIFLNKKKNRLLVNIKTKESEPVVFEVLKI